MPRKKIEGVCSVEGCGKPIDSKRFCRNHYMMNYLYGRTTKLYTGDKRNNPLYHLWFDRKSANQLCEAWQNFDTFIKDISPKPEGNFFLVRLTNAPFGPDNFKWQEHLKRKEGETNKEWWARKRAARIAANPSMDRARNYKRFFNYSIEQYEQQLKLQNYVCAICNQPETSVDGRTGGPKRLAIDHCHDSNKVRELLCYRCNATLGKIEDSVELLQKMINYLNKHKETW